MLGNWVCYDLRGRSAGWGGIVILGLSFVMLCSVCKYSLKDVANTMDSFEQAVTLSPRVVSTSETGPWYRGGGHRNRESMRDLGDKGGKTGDRPKGSQPTYLNR